MTTVQLTPTEVAAWADVPEGGTFLLVREGEEDDLDRFIREENLPVERGPLRPPAEFVQACAPCETVRHAMAGWNGQLPRPACRIELVVPCPDCENPMLTPIPGRAKCRGGVLTLGWAYAVGQPQQTDDGKWELELRRA